MTQKENAYDEANVDNANKEYWRGYREGKQEILDKYAELEKQSELVDINPSEFDLRLNKLLKQFETLSKEELANSLSFYLNVVQNNGTYKLDEKQVKQKLVDKDEPMFKVGDILVSEEEDRRHIYKVDAITNYGTYLLLDLEDGYTRNESIYTSDLTMYLWTIADAKDGDVLADKYNNIGIFKKCEGICWHSYIYLGCDGKLRGFSIGGSHEQTKTHLATKEQRDALERAITNAGYRWDKEKLKLKNK